MARKTTQQLAYTALRIEGGLIPAEELTRLTTLAAPEATGNTPRAKSVPTPKRRDAEAARRERLNPQLSPKEVLMPILKVPVALVFIWNLSDPPA